MRKLKIKKIIHNARCLWRCNHVFALLFVLHSCHPGTQHKINAPVTVTDQIGALKKRTFEVPIDSGLVIQQQVSILAKRYGLTDELIRSYCRLGYFIGRTQMDVNKGKRMIDSAGMLAKESDSKKMGPLVDLYYSVLYSGRDDSLASHYMEKVMPRLNELLPPDKIMALCSMGNIHSQRGNYASARKYYLHALDIAEHQTPRDFKAEIAIHDVMGIGYRATKDTLAAIKEWKKALALCTDSIEKLGEIEYFYSNFGQCYIEMGRPDSALPLIRKYAAIVRANYTDSGARLLPNLYFAEIALQRKEYKKADGLLIPYGNYIGTMDMDARSLPNDWFVYGYYETLYKVKKATGDYAGAMKALEDQKRFDALVNRKKNDDKLLQYDRNLEKTKMDKAVAEQEKKAANSRLILFLVIFLLSLAIAVGLVIFFRNKKRLEAQKLKGLYQASVIEKKELLLEAETAERKRIAREFHDELGGALTVIGMAAQALRGFNIEAIAGPVEILQRNSQKLTTQVNEIVWSLNDRNDTLGSLLAYVQRYMDQFLSDAGIMYTSSFQVAMKELPVEGYKRRYLFQSIKECFNNAVKHSGATALRCTAVTTPELLRLTIEDNGSGMPDEALLVKGNGLDNIRSNITALGGDVRWERGIDTRVVIEVPLKGLGKAKVT
ncbi:tetratricopeptide repeat-containing sensor histidine kinase [Niabella drilacis]|uniref:histidine kinase n=1 Tax=Niabella drilacis (strain DSM 25811 / CCM 8410 / CCUG 62505 / LMG 26954 / E90) TaxID=1285928 RepID=A0A1G7A4S8_NIADE|nr:tetratricopeptide repeat-containing sensor histidine kinase [Niabella drilacis]SDE09792.1 Histidine kinase-, DNA gyrase B-, and HSP90-like ATPase [Niabella drilacis]